MRTFLRWCAITLVTIVLLAVGGYVFHGLEGASDVARAKRAAAAELAAALPASRAHAARDRDRVVAVAATEWGRPAYTWQELECDLDTVDAGWIVQYYVQECRIQSVDLIPVATAPGARCAWTPVPPLPVTTSGPGAGPPAAAIHAGPASAFDDEHPYRFGCPGGIVGPPKYATSRLLSGHKPTSLDGSAAWVVVSVETDVSRTELGCDPWAVVFCSEPVDGPVLGDVGKALDSSR